jgi:two-component system, response regulator PdtaR
MNSAATHRPVVIVSEDEFLARMFNADFLNEAGFQVLEASNAHEALRLLGSRPDVEALVTDVEMPGTIDGLALARRVRNETPEIAVLVVSGRVTPTRQQLPDGARFLSKPVEPATVLRVLGELMGRCSRAAIEESNSVDASKAVNEDVISRRALELWEQRGRPEGYDREFWLQAERELNMGRNRAGVSANANASRSGSGSDGPSA